MDFRHFVPKVDSCSAARTALAIPSLSPELFQRLENCSNEVLDRRVRQTELAADLLVALSLHHVSRRCGCACSREVMDLRQEGDQSAAPPATHKDYFSPSSSARPCSPA